MNDVVRRNEKVTRTIVCDRGVGLLTGWRNARKAK
jgi:hypothetical protein